MKNNWGPCIWHILHTIAKNYPNKPSNSDKHKANQLVNLIAFIIPCFKCQKHYMSNITKYKPNLDSNESFFKWTVKIHNIVNKDTNKPIIVLNKAYKLTDSALNSKMIQKLFVYLRLESSNYNISRSALIRFIDVITYFNNAHIKKKAYIQRDICFQK
jgi:FAD-linked sulfhydryl oxidase